ncbi:MAG: hypothetical protein DRO40_13610 [Thermoprotei archaeon]|nr:MAG: hypothetical protein DRO40_13610 [Thermoprotei archaeon]
MKTTVCVVEITRANIVECDECGRIDEGYVLTFYLGDLEAKYRICSSCFYEKVKSKAGTLEEEL